MGPENIDIGIQCDLPHDPVTSSDVGMQFGLCPLAAFSPRTIPTSCSESELSEVDDNTIEGHPQEHITHHMKVNHCKCNC